MKGKKLIVLLLMLTGCTSLRDVRPLKTQGFEQELGYTEGKKLTKVQNKIPLSNGGTTIVLNSIKDSWESGQSYLVDFDSPIKSVQNYVGEYLNFDGSSFKNVRVVGTKLPQYTLEKNGENYKFRSLFQNEFQLELTRKNGKKEIVIIENILKYKITSDEVYENTRNSYNNKDYGDTINNIDLYFIAFNNSEKIQELNVILINVYIDTMRYLDAQKKIDEIKNSKTLTEWEISSIFKGELKINSYNLVISDNYFNYGEKYPSFSDELIKYLSVKPILTQREYNYLLGESEKKGDENLKKIVQNKSFVTTENSSNPNIGNTDATEENIDTQAQVTGNFSQEDKENYEKGINSYKGKRYGEAVLYLERVTDKSMDEEINFYIGDSYFKQESYEKAVLAYSKFVEKGEDSIKKGEAMYNIGFSYEKLGDKNSAEKWYKKVMESYRGTIWARKGNIGIIRVKK